MQAYSVGMGFVKVLKGTVSDSIMGPHGWFKGVSKALVTAVRRSALHVTQGCDVLQALTGQKQDAKTLGTNVV